jgi:hypothetical protein
LAKEVVTEYLSLLPKLLFNLNEVGELPPFFNMMFKIPELPSDEKLAPGAEMISTRSTMSNGKRLKAFVLEELTNPEGLPSK